MSFIKIVEIFLSKIIFSSKVYGVAQHWACVIEKYKRDGLETLPTNGASNALTVSWIPQNVPLRGTSGFRLSFSSFYFQLVSENFNEFSPLLNLLKSQKMYIAEPFHNTAPVRNAIIITYLYP